jgi:hypothetical protein
MYYEFRIKCRHYHMILDRVFLTVVAQSFLPEKRQRVQKMSPTLFYFYHIIFLSAEGLATVASCYLFLLINNITKKNQCTREKTIEFMVLHQYINDLFKKQ